MLHVARSLLTANQIYTVMKRIIFLFSLLLTTAYNASAQADVANEIANMLSSGNVNGLSEHFMNSVDLTILNNEDVYSKTQATQVTKRFFDENTAKGFTVKHEGKSKLEDHYRIGTLNTSKGNYRVTYFLKNHEGKYLIKKLRIEANDRDF